MKLNDVKASEIAKIIYDYAVDNAVQDIITENDHMHDPRYDVDVPQKTWTSCCDIDFDGLKLKIRADFECPTCREYMEKETCDYIHVEYVVGTPEQDDLFDAYNSAIEYELRNIAGYYCSVCVE